MMISRVLNAAMPAEVGDVLRFSHDPGGQF
jgi:hypothetical protein